MLAQEFILQLFIGKIEQCLADAAVLGCHADQLFIIVTNTQRIRQTVRNASAAAAVFTADCNYKFLHTILLRYSPK